MYFIYYSVENQITSDGLRYLSTSNLSNLKKLYLGKDKIILAQNNKLGRRGVQFLAKSFLPQLD